MRRFYRIDFGVIPSYIELPWYNFGIFFSSMAKYNVLIYVRKLVKCF